MTREDGWSDEQVEDFCKEIKARHGKHWAYIPPTLHEAIVAEQVMKAVRATSLASADLVTVRDIVSLHRRLAERLAAVATSWVR